MAVVRQISTRLDSATRPELDLLGLGLHFRKRRRRCPDFRTQKTPRPGRLLVCWRPMTPFLVIGLIPTDPPKLNVACQFGQKLRRANGGLPTCGIDQRVDRGQEPLPCFPLPDWCSLRIAEGDVNIVACGVKAHSSPPLTTAMTGWRE